MPLPRVNHGNHNCLYNNSFFRRILIWPGAFRLSINSATFVTGRGGSRASSVGTGHSRQTVDACTDTSPERGDCDPFERVRRLFHPKGGNVPQMGPAARLGALESAYFARERDVRFRGGGHVAGRPVVFVANLADNLRETPIELVRIYYRSLI